MSSWRHRHLIDFAIRCYPSSWRRRHGDEANEIAVALVADGISVWSIVWSYLSGAVVARCTMTPTRRLGAILASTVLAGSLIGMPSVLAASSSSPARAAHSHKVFTAISHAHLVKCHGLVETKHADPRPISAHTSSSEAHSLQFSYHPSSLSDLNAQNSQTHDNCAILR